MGDVSEATSRHQAVVAAVYEKVRDVRGALLTTEAVLTEAMYLLGRTRSGGWACLDFFLRVEAFLVPFSWRALARCGRLMRTYADLPADVADAILVALAEEADT